MILQNKKKTSEKYIKRQSILFSFDHGHTHYTTDCKPTSEYMKFLCHSRNIQYR